MARKRWGDRFSDNWIIDYLTGFCLILFMGIYISGGVLVALFFGLAIFTGMLPGTMGAPISMSIDALVISDKLRYIGRSAILLGTSAGAAVVVSHATAVSLNYLDKMIADRVLSQSSSKL